MTGFEEISSLRIFYAFDLPLSGDETVSLLQSTGHTTERIAPIVRNTVPIEKVKAFLEYNEEFQVSSVLRSLTYAGMHPPLYYLGLHYVMRLLDNDPFKLRLLSTIFSVLSIAAMYFLGKAVCDRKTGLCAAAFLALSAYGVSFGPMVRPYPLALLLAT